MKFDGFLSSYHHPHTFSRVSNSTSKPDPFLNIKINLILYNTPGVLKPLRQNYDRNSWLQFPPSNSHHPSILEGTKEIFSHYPIIRAL